MTDFSELSLTKPDLGAMLQQARQAKGLEIEELANRLRIRRPYLEALEKNDFAALPGSVYGIGFVRSYARALDLSEADMVALYKSQNNIEQVRPKYESRTPKTETRMPRGIPLAIGGGVAVAILLLWYITHSEVGTLPTRISTVPEPLAQATKSEPNPLPTPTPTPLALVPPSTATTGSGTPTANGGQNGANNATNSLGLVPLAPITSGGTSNQAASSQNNPQSNGQTNLAPLPLPINRAASSPATTSAAPKNTVVANNKPELKPDATAQVKPAKQEKPAKPANAGNNAAAPAASVVGKENANGVYGAAEGNSRVVITATQDSWLEISRKDDRTVIFSRLLKAGEKYNVPNMRSGLLLSTGNAGGLSVTVDANAAPDLGPNGAVRHEIDLTPEKLTAGTAVPKQIRKPPAPAAASPATTP